MGEHKGSITGATLLIAGTSIGAGMLAIPLVTGVAGFLPALFISFICWLFMMATGLLFLEVTLWMPDGSNVMSMSGQFLGPIGKLVAGIFYLFLYYCLMVSYLAGGSSLFTSALQNVFSFSISYSTGFLFFSCAFGLVVLFGAWVVDRVNWLFMAGLILSYLLLLGIGAEEVNPSFLVQKNWKASLFATPILFSAYGYHNIIPSLSTYLKRNRNHLRIAIITGTTITFVIYSLWQWMIIGSVPAHQLSQAAMKGVPASQILLDVTGNPFIAKVALFFGLFTIVTSLLGVSLSMVDFLGDGFRVKREGMVRLGLVLLVFLPPSSLAFYKPGLFVEALGIAGGYGEAFLNGLLPISMVWIGRYWMKLEGKDMISGGRPLLLLLFLFTCFIMFLETWHLFA